MGIFLILGILFTAGVLFVQFGLFSCGLLTLNFLAKPRVSSHCHRRRTINILIFSVLLFVLTLGSYIYYVTEQATCLNLRATACDQLYKSIPGRYWKMNIGTGLVGTASISTFLKVLNNE